MRISIAATERRRRSIIHIGANEIEISNPGGLLGDLTPDSLLYAPAMYRNFALADGARQFGVCEKAGVGLNKVFMQLAAAGYDFPYFEVGTNSFKVILKTQRDVAFAKFIQDHAGTLNLKLTGLVILRVLRTKSESDVEFLARKAQRPVDYVEDVIGELERSGLVAMNRRKGTLTLTPSVIERIELYDDRGQLRLL